MGGEVDSGSSLNVEQVFDSYAERYDRWYEKPFGTSAFNLEKACIESVCQGLEQPFLEIGVGTGRFAEALKIEYGIDISAGVLRFAKERGIMVVRGKGENLPFRNNSFGAVFIIVTICFVDNPLKVLEEARRVLKDNGSMVLGLILEESPWASFYKKKGEMGNVFYKVAKFYSFKELKAIIEEAKLKIESISSTIFQAPTEDLLHFEPPKVGYYERAGFVAVKLGKIGF
ncbi:MAG: class I SAM-dependent methyltransferase [Nitrososphaeria archaeon]